LDVVPHGLAEAPDHLRETLVDVASRAAVRLFDTVIDEGADFLVLAGDVVDPRRASPRTLALLVEQFERLAARHIPIYWAAGETDGEASWPQSIPLPESVYRRDTGQGDQILHERDAVPVARIIFARQTRAGQVRTSDLLADPTGLFTMAVANGLVATTLNECKLGYLALGGEHARRTAATTPVTAIYSGTHQGRCPAESGPHGCTMVEVDSSGRIRTRLIPTDVARWQDETVTLDAAATAEDLRRMLRDRMNSIRETAVGRDSLISWRIVGRGPLASELRRGASGEELLAWLQTEFGVDSPAAWSCSLTTQAAGEPPEAWREQETILGDYLRLVQQHQEDDALPLDLAEQLSESQAAGVLGDWARLDEPGERQRVLRSAAWLGADLLGANRGGG
jgi:hypothetical protein